MFLYVFPRTASEIRQSNYQLKFLAGGELEFV